MDFSTDRNANHIKAIRITNHTEPRYPHRGGVKNPALLPLRDALNREPKVHSASGLHLHEGHEGGTPDDQIDLAPTDTEMVVDQRPSAPDEPAGSDPFTEETERERRGSSHAPKVERLAGVASPPRGARQRNPAAAPQRDAVTTSVIVRSRSRLRTGFAR